MRPVVAAVGLFSHLCKRPVALERPQQLVVAAARFVESRHDRIHDAQIGLGRDALRRDAFPWRDPAATASHERGPSRATSGVFKRAYHGRAHGDDATPSMLRLINK
jgi:hypothetical protein